MHYEINVSLNGRHFFATTERSLRDQERAREVFNEMLKRFPESEGFKVTCTRWESVGKQENWG